MSAYLTKDERAALARLLIAERRRQLSERFRRDCPRPGAASALSHPGHVFVDGCSLASFDFAAAQAFDKLEAQIERDISPPARVVQLIAPAVPMRVSHARYDEGGRHIEFDRQSPVLALALRADGTISAITEHDVAANGALTEHHPYPEVETGRAYYLDEDTGEATPTVPDTAAEEMLEITASARAARRRRTADSGQERGRCQVTARHSKIGAVRAELMPQSDGGFILRCVSPKLINNSQAGGFSIYVTDDSIGASVLAALRSVLDPTNSPSEGRSHARAR